MLLVISLIRLHAVGREFDMSSGSPNAGGRLLLKRVQEETAEAVCGHVAARLAAGSGVLEIVESHEAVYTVRILREVPTSHAWSRFR